MRLSDCKFVLILTASLLFQCDRVWGQSPTVSGMSPSSGPAGMTVALTGTGFGSTQGSSTVSLNGIAAPAFIASRQGHRTIFSRRLEKCLFRRVPKIR